MRRVVFLSRLVPLAEAVLVGLLLFALGRALYGDVAGLIRPGCGSPCRSALASATSTGSTCRWPWPRWRARSPFSAISDSPGFFGDRPRSDGGHRASDPLHRSDPGRCPGGRGDDPPSRPLAAVVDRLGGDPPGRMVSRLDRLSSHRPVSRVPTGGPGAPGGGGGRSAGSSAPLPGRSSTKPDCVTSTGSTRPTNGRRSSCSAGNGSESAGGSGRTLLVKLPVAVLALTLLGALFR